MPVCLCSCNRWQVFALGNFIGQPSFDDDIAFSIQHNIEIGKKSLKIPVLINILSTRTVKPAHAVTSIKRPPILSGHLY